MNLLTRATSFMASESLVRLQLRMADGLNARRQSNWLAAGGGNETKSIQAKPPEAIAEDAKEQRARPQTRRESVERRQSRVHACMPPTTHGTQRDVQPDPEQERELATASEKAKASVGSTKKAWDSQVPLSMIAA